MLCESPNGPNGVATNTDILEEISTPAYPQVCSNPVGVDDVFGLIPRVARPSQPWAECRYPRWCKPNARIVAKLDALATETQRLARLTQ